MALTSVVVLTTWQYGILHGCELAIVARPFVRDPELLAEFGPGEDYDSEIGLQYEPKIKSESERGGFARVMYLCNT